MPIIYLSPSTQEFNPYVNGGTEEFYMNLIADNMEPYLRSSGIQYLRNTPDMTAASSITQSNSGNYDLHVALHSNASPQSQAGENRGSIVFYYPSSVKGRRAADIIASNLKDLYPYPNLVRAEPSTSLGELSQTRAPAVLIEFAFHDNPEDADWIKSNIQAIAKNVVYSLTEYFDIPFVNPQPERIGTVRLQYGYLNIRAKPDTGAASLARAYNGNKVVVLGQWQDWYVVRYHGTVGYANSRYITLDNY